MKRPLYIILLLVAIVILMVVNLLIGSVRIPVADVCGILAGTESNEIWENIIWKSRLPALRQTGWGGALATGLSG